MHLQTRIQLCAPASRADRLGALLAVPVIVAGSICLTPTNETHRYDYKLISDEALIIIPVDNAEYAQFATKLYLDPLGFDGTPTTINIPEVISGDTLNQALNTGVQDLVTAVEQQYNAGAIDPNDPLFIFGYSQSSVEAGLAEQQLADYGIPEQDLHFVLVGDSASADGGYLNTYLDSLPESTRQFVTSLLHDFGADEVVGLKTPDNLYPTDVYSLSGDGWVNYADGANNLGMFTDHLEYLGLTPAEVGSATLSLADGLTNYWTINDSVVNSFEALWTQLMMAVSVF
jgi:hypothetical protein